MRIKNNKKILNIGLLPPNPLFGANQLQALRYQEYFEGAYGLIDFITNMMYFASVLYIKIHNDPVNGEFLKAFLFISSLLGFLISFASWDKGNEHTAEQIKDLDITAHLGCTSRTRSLIVGALLIVPSQGHRYGPDRFYSLLLFVAFRCGR